jgi:hypothetical protein
VDLNNLTLGDKIIGGTGIVLLITLLFLPWHSIDLGPFGGSINRTAVQSPNSIWGVLALLLTIVVVLAALLPKLTDVKLPDLPIPTADAILYGAIATLALLLLKLVIETESLGFGAFLAILLAGGMAYGAFQSKQDAEKAPGPDAAPPQPF